MATDKRKKNQVQLRTERAKVRSSGGEAIEASPSIAAPRQSYREHVTGGAYKVPSTRTLENLAAEHIAKQEEEKRRTQTSPATSFSGMQDWRPSYMRQQAQPALTQPQPVISRPQPVISRPQPVISRPQTTVPAQNRQTPTNGNVNGPSPAAITRQEGTVRQNDGRASGPKMPSIGRFGAGNIDLFNRPRYRQPDGSLSTVNSISIGTDDGEVLIPTIGRDAQGRPVQWTDDEAIEQYNKTGQYLGKFNTVEEADRYADQLHRQQEVYYGSDIGKNDPVSMQRLMGIRGGIDRSGGVNQTIGNMRDDVEILQGEPKNLTREGQWAARHPYAGTAMYGVTNVVGSGEGVFNTAEAALRALATGEKMDPNSMKAAPLAQAYRTGSAEGFRRGLQDGITAPVAKAIGIDSDDGRYSRGEQAMDFLSGVVADRVSSLMNMGIAGGLSGRMNALTPAQMATIGTASGALMGANAANQSLYESSQDEDTTARQALALGITSGIWEALFEAYSTESLLSNASPTSIKDLLVKTAAQFGVEFQEEAATEGANIISDYIIRGDDSEIGKDVAAFKANNPDADPNEVARHALLSALYQVSMAGLGGGLSGAMGGGAIALNQFYGGSQLRSGVRSGDVSLNDIANTADTSTPEGQRVYELANELARREAEGRRTGAMRYGALNNAIINDIDANWETRLEQAAATANARENAIDRTNRIREALRGDNAQAAWETPEDTGVRDVVLPSEMREEAAYDLLETRNADRISWDTEQGFVSLDRETDGSYTFTNERGETVTMDSQQAAELIPAEQMLTIYDYEGNTEAQNQIADTQDEAQSTATDVPSTEPTAPSTVPSTADTGINTSTDNVNADVERQNMVEARVAPDATADQNLTQSGGEIAQQTAAQDPVAISQQNTSGNQYVAQTANERLEQAAQQVTQRRTVEKAAQLRAVYEARKNNSPNLRSVVNGATMLSQAEVTRALDMGARDAVVATSAQEEISNGRQEGESLSGQRSDGILPQRTGERTGRVSAETEAVRRIWRSGEAPADSGAEVLRFTERRRASEVIPESSEDSFVYIPANKTELMEQGEAEANSFGLNVVSWAGGEAVSNKGNYFRGSTVPGSDELYAQADNADFTQDKIIKHEIAENKLSKAEFEQIIEEAKEKSDFVKAAIEIYQSLSGEDEYRSAKELVCDSNGRMNQFEKRAQENPDNEEYQVIREILQRAIDTINPIVSAKLETKKVQRTAASAAAATKVSSLPGVTPQEKAGDVNNSTEHSVELPYRFGSEAANAWVQSLEPEAKKTAEMFSELHDIGLHNKANVRVGVGAGSHMKRIDVTTRNMLASEWNSYIDSSETFADTAKKLAEALPDNVRKEANISKDGRILATPFEKEFKMMRSFMQRIVDALPIKLTGNTTMVNGKEVKISNKKQIYGVGGEEYRKALLEERRRQYREGILAKKSIGGLSKDTWGTMGFLASNTKTTASGDFTTFCPQMYFGNKGCWYCYRLSALRSGVNNKLVGEKVWYTGEILRLKQADIDALNKAGGLRIQSFGDWMDMFSPQLLDMLVDAETVGLQIKIITKEPSMIDTVALLKEQGFGKNLYFNLSADYTIEEASGTINPARPYMSKDGKTYWKRALTVEEANEYRKKYRWVNTRIVATNLDEFIRGLESPYVDVVTGYHGKDFAKSGFERISSEDGQVLTEVEALGDAGMPRFRFMPSTGTWVREFDGKTKTHKRLADAIEERGLQYAYYIKTCCQTGRCASCEGKCGALARDFNIKNATNRDTESVKYWQKVMRGNTSNIGGEGSTYPFQHLLKTESLNQLSKEQEQRQAIYQAGLDMDEDYEDVIESANLIPMEERYRIFQDGMKAAQNRGNQSNANETATQTVPEGEDASSQTIASDMGVQHSTKITDEDLIKKLEKEIAAGDYIETYKAMQVVGGELYPPMAGKVKGTDGKYRMNNPYTLKAWHQSDEDLANAIFKPGNDKYAYYKLKKGDGSRDVPAAYNPYEHSSNTVLNDQFDTANKRGNLVVVRCLIPKSEIYGKDRYKAQFAKDSTGIIDWKSGEVSTSLKKLKPNEARVVYLSRYIKPVEIMKPEFVAGEWKKALDGTDLSVPFNVVTPELLSALEKLNVPINYAGTGNYQRYNKPKATKKADIETAADDKANSNVIRQGSDQDIQYSSKLFDKDVDERLRVRMATLFSGAGTVDFALRSIVQHEFAVEFKDKIAAVYRANNGGTMYVKDIQTVNVDPHKGRVEYLHISPVCTDYSNANNKQGERDIDLKTAEAAARIIDNLQPKVITVENVRRYKNSRAVRIIEEALERNGYLHDKKVYRASNFGGATIRERMFIRAVKDGVLPKVDTSEYTPLTWYDAVKDMIPKLPPAELSNYMRGRLGVSGIDPDNLKQPVFVLGGEKSGELTFATADKPAPTILAKSTEAKILMPDGRILRATPRVMARIQGLPDEFDLGLKNDYDMEESRGNVTNAYRVVGNGVPVQLTQGIVGPLLEENLIKQKSKETGIQYSSKLDSAGSKLTEQQVEYFKNSKIRDKNGNLKRMYHGTRRADRVGTVFRPEMATSGPMAYFTDDESIAQNYSRDKEDTSLKKEGAGDYHRMFRMNIGGKAYTVEDAWDRLPASKRAEIRRKAPHITMDDDYENIIYDKNANKGLGNYDNYLIRDNGGNYIKALVESWLDDGTLYGEESKFKNVLSLVGLDDVEYLDPEFRDEKVYAVYLNVTNPLVTNDIPQEVINNLRKASETAEWNGPDSNVDSWDKTNVSPQEWLKDFERDIENGTAYVWTRIPDWVTNVLKDMGYDGISDMGGKKGGVTHNVVIPFSSEQIKNIDNQNPTKNVDIRYSSKLQDGIDKKYDAALRGNDMKTAERLVKEAAEEAGYKLAVYHGTGENFTVFNPGFEGIHLGNREQAEDVAKTRFDQRSKNSNYKWKDIRNRVKEMNREQRESLVSAAYRLGDYYDAPADDFAFDGNIMNDKEVTDYVDREVEGYGKATGENNPRFTMRTFDRETGENVMELYAKINNPLVINGDIVDWEMEHIARLLKAIDHGDDKFLPLFRRDYIDISNAKLKLTSEDKKLLNQAVRTATSDTAVESWNALKEVLANHGYDGIQYKNEYEGDRQSWSYIALNPSDVKSAEAVTYDDNGNVIPPSERFNPENEDIRFSRSLTGNMSTTEIDRKLNELVKKYGALPKGEKPARNVDVPMQTSDNKNTRRFVRTILESGITSADLDDSIKSAIINESLSYEVATDKEAAEYAASVIRIGGVERAQREWDKARRSDTFNKDHMALGQFLLKEYAKNNDIDNAMNMIQDLAAEGTRMGQNIQAMRMLKKYAQQVPAIGLGYIQRTVDQMNREAKAKMGKRYKEMRIAPNLAAEYIKAQTRDEIDAALGKIYKNLGSQVQKTVPEEIYDRLRTWRYMSMLGNPRTHIRNLVGNALFVPAVTLKNAIGTGLEGAMNTSVKTKSLTVTKQAMEFAKQDALDMQDVLSGESEKSIRDLIMDQRKVYKFEPLNKASKGNSAALEAEDWVFLRLHYQNALAQYITANNLDTTVQNPAWLGRARRYAVQEAQKATYRDANKVSTWLNQSKGAGAVVKYMMEGLMPFKKTPTNILRRGIEYSPAGLVRTMSKSIYDLNTGKMTVNEWIDALSSGLAGTAIFGIGMFLASTGAILGGYKDDDDKELRKLKGLQEYSVIIGNHTYTIDWAAPGSLPLFIGVETMNALKQERGMTMDDMGKAAARLIDPMINMSMLSGLNDTLDAISYSDDKLSAATMEMFYSLLGQYVPTLFGQVARTIDTTQRINYQDVNTGKPKNMLYFIEKMQNKIPFLTFSNDPYLNEFGQENSGTPHWAAALQNFVSPGYVSEIKDDHVLDEVARLNEAQDKEKVLPRKMNKYIGSGKDRIDLTSSEYHTFQKVAGQTAYNILDAMIDDNRYNSMNANQQATAIKMAYDYAKAVGRIEIQPKYKEDLDGKVKKVYEDVQNGMQAYDSILNRIRTDNVSEGIKPDIDENGNAVANSAKYKTIDKILGTSMSKAEQARTFETAFPSEALDRWKASGGDTYDYMMGVKLQQDVSKLSDEKKKKTYEYVVNSKNYTNYQKVAWFVSDKNRTESKNYLAWKDAKGSDWDYIKSRSDLEKFVGLDTKTKRSKVIGYIKKQTTNEAKRKALWQMAGYDLDSKKDGKTVKNGNYNKYFK